MYSRYSGYQPFVPMNNRLSRFREEDSPAPLPLPSEPALMELPAEPREPAPSVSAPSDGGGLGLEKLLAGLGGGKGLFGNSGGKGLFGNKGILGSKGLLGGLFGKEGGIGSLLKGIRLDWDAGDILLILIVLFLSLEGDDDEIIWIIAIALITGF